MSRRIFRDVEEALSREVRRITFHENRTTDHKVLKDTFDPFTGEIVSLPIEPKFYDSSADAHNIQYPHFFIRLLKSREDRESGRVVPQYGKWIETPVKTSPRAYEIVLGGSDGLINAIGNKFETSNFQIRKAVAGHYLRILSGNNKGTYIIDSVVPSSVGPHSIFVSNTLVENLPTSSFNTTTRDLQFTQAVDLNTIVIGDNFIDASNASFPITAININTNTITLGGMGSPDLSAGGELNRPGDVFPNTDLSVVRYIIMDPSKPITALTACGPQDAFSSTSNVSPQVPLDIYYLIRIDSKERDTHIDILNRVWEEFNPPRTGLPIIRRSALSAEELLTSDVSLGGSSTINVGSNANYEVGDSVFIFDDLMPSKSADGKFQRPFKSKIIDKISNNQLVLDDTVPDTFKIENRAKIVSNADFVLWMFHFVDHVTKDIEGAQYWVHEFTFWVQIWVDRLEVPSVYGVITDIATPIEDLEGNVIIEDC